MKPLSISMLPDPSKALAASFRDTTSAACFSKAAIVADADLAAQRCVIHRVQQPNPHLPRSAEGRIWWSAYLRLLLLHSAPTRQPEAVQ